MNIRPKTEHEIDIMIEGGQILSDILRATSEEIKAGRSLQEIDESIGKLIKNQGAEPSFLGFRGYPAYACLSLNAAVVHGIPDNTVLKEGDVLGVDVGIKWQGYHTDAAFTVGIGKISPEDAQLIEVTQKALSIGINEALSGNRVEDIGRAIEAFVRKQGKFGIIRDLSGHGIGQSLQEPPEVFNFATSNPIPLINGMTLAIEPMISRGDWRVRVAADEWTVLTKDNTNAAHFESTIIVRDNDPQILVDYPLTC